MLENINLKRKLSREEYKLALPSIQQRLYDLEKACWDHRVATVIVFEGWDASGKGTVIAALTNAPANWHFLSISFDPEFDSPAMLKAYGDSYQYDPQHWSFLTGPPDKISELARSAGVTYKSEDGTIDHNFRTLIIDAAGHLQMIFPTSGDLSDAIVGEIIKAAASNQPVAQNQNP